MRETAAAAVTVEGEFGGLAEHPQCRMIRTSQKFFSIVSAKERLGYAKLQGAYWGDPVSVKRPDSD
jgi:hypothetical protein